MHCAPPLLFTKCIESENDLHRFGLARQVCDLDIVCVGRVSVDEVVGEERLDVGGLCDESACDVVKLYVGYLKGHGDRTVP